MAKARSKKSKNKSAKAGKDRRVKSLRAHIAGVSEKFSELGSKILAMSNLGHRLPEGGFKDEAQVHNEYRRCAQNHGMEGIEIEPERLDWHHELKSGDDFSIRTVKRHAPWLQ